MDLVPQILVRLSHDEQVRNERLGTYQFWPSQLGLLVDHTAQVEALVVPLESC